MPEPPLFVSEHSSSVTRHRQRADDREFVSIRDEHFWFRDPFFVSATSIFGSGIRFLSPRRAFLVPGSSCLCDEHFCFRDPCLRDESFWFRDPLSVPAMSIFGSRIRLLSPRRAFLAPRSVFCIRDEHFWSRDPCFVSAMSICAISSARNKPTRAGFAIASGRKCPG